MAGDVSLKAMNTQSPIRCAGFLNKFLLQMSPHSYMDAAVGWILGAGATLEGHCAFRAGDGECSVGLVPEILSIVASCLIFFFFTFIC